MTVIVEFTVFKGSKEGKIIKSTTKKELKANEILIKTTHSGRAEQTSTINMWTWDWGMKVLVLWR
jgi:hypothetical protein